LYNRFVRNQIAIGTSCSDGFCPGECLGVGSDFSRDNDKVCTKECSAPTDCPAPTTCTTIDVISVDKSGSKMAPKGYCLPAQR
jgi:hypothetical protein